jgi:hypothetical protein
MALRKWAALMRCAACRLHVGLVRGAIMAQHEGQSRHAFPANDAALDAALTRSIRHHRGKAALDEEDVVHAGIGHL